ncbi:Uncharacterised protein [Anaerococcus prevotii]|uniref:ABC-2 family transporter protein n=1 Tax=Anaerococcus prevotii (strain ATCC 9321 / DSM 20548 / JCM 6508 / NCTC 11806 / PC1) TaxID=525919 RepID=C7REC9_ANAPD|nr:hypothetical protein [Anaerococcus prevotii]ACV29542.1 hypothetical protein Apre_1521 [Anaerococcus prevotii DSM 20548]SUU95216.1 Uncharacterised protein [Anaerococcus prevotii]
MNLIIIDLRKLLDKNALLMALMALFCSFMALFLGDGGGFETNKVINIIKIDGILILFVMFGVELSKNTLLADKISKRIEFLLANGLSIGKILVNYLLSIYLGTLIIVLPSLILNLSRLGISLGVLLNFLLTSLLYTTIIVLLILHTTNMNKINSLQIRLIGLSIGVMMISLIAYMLTNMIELYLISKILILSAIIVFLYKKTNKERIVVSYY